MGLFDRFKKRSRPSWEESLAALSAGTLSLQEFVNIHASHPLYYSTPFGENRAGRPVLWLLSKANSSMQFYPAFLSKEYAHRSLSSAGRQNGIIIKGTLQSLFSSLDSTPLLKEAGVLIQDETGELEIPAHMRVQKQGRMPMPIASLQIQKVDKDTPLAKELLNFVEHFSWLEVKDHTVSLIKNWGFEEWETPFVATVEGRIVGLVTLMKTDYYPLPEIYPWVSTLFVSEEYRGYRISERLIDFANAYAKGIGFHKTYIPSEHVGLYEKYGYRYLKDIVNYGGGTDRLYVKDLT